jgi:carboxyl-terminal processing protease
LHINAIKGPLKFGDRILEVNKISWKDFYKQDSVFIQGSNEKLRKNTSAEYFIRSVDDIPKVLKVIRNDSVIEVLCPFIQASKFSKETVIKYSKDSSSILGENYLYLDLSRMDSVEFEKIILKNPRPNIIIDLRTYPKCVLDQIADLFAYNRVPFAAYSYPDLSMPGSFSPLRMMYLEPRRKQGKVKYQNIYLLVNYTTGSMGEFTVMAFQALPNVTTVGDQTAGADGDVSMVILPGNITTFFSGLGIYYPNGGRTQQVGVKIDKPFIATGWGISSGQDEGLYFTLNLLKKEGEK